MVYSNYPNPFRYETSIRLDPPWPARVRIEEVLDVTGQLVFTSLLIELRAGAEQDISLPNMPLPSETYLYRLTADSDEEYSLQIR